MRFYKHKMKKIKIIMWIAVMVTAVMLAGCTADLQENERESDINVIPTEESEETNSATSEMSNMKLTIGEYQFTVILEDNETAGELAKQLPLTLNMSELNGNEKYNYLPFSLPTDAYSPMEIKSGDVMLYGDNCLVVFYESFRSSYRYTKVGHIEDVTDLKEAVGAGGVQMEFSN